MSAYAATGIGGWVGPNAGLEQVYALWSRRDQRLQAVLGRLPEEQQTALTLAYYGNKTHVEITQERSARTIRSRISMAMRKLQTDLASADQRP